MGHDKPLPWKMVKLVNQPIKKWKNWTFQGFHITYISWKPKVPKQFFHACVVKLNPPEIFVWWFLFFNTIWIEGKHGIFSKAKFEPLASKLLRFYCPASACSFAASPAALNESRDQRVKRMKIRNEWNQRKFRPSFGREPGIESCWNLQIWKKLNEQIWKVQSTSGWIDRYCLTNSQAQGKCYQTAS